MGSAEEEGARPPAEEPFSDLDLSGDFDCPICQEVFKTPIRTKTCKHVFCKHCFVAAVRACGPHCPMCRGPVSEDEKRATDVARRMRTRRGRCRACGSCSVFSQMRRHYKYCRKYREEYGNPVVPRAQGTVSGGAQSTATIRNLTAVHDHRPVLGPESMSMTYSCPYCQQPGLSDMSLVQHCRGNHVGNPAPVVCPICAATSWGNPSYYSTNFIGHLNQRHRFSYDNYTNTRVDEDALFHLAVEQSVRHSLQNNQL
nr:PREDICTED: E3 ubiquitin-protein ligase RNF138-like isoform X1 [Lepisosteus oculatus]